MRRAASKRSTGPSPCCRCARACPRGRRTTIVATAPPCLFAALRLFDGLVLGDCRAKRDTAGFVRFLDQIDAVTVADHAIHVILDNLSTHKSPPVQAWLAAHPRVRFHFIPTGSSWLNLVERWFGEITRQRIRRGTFRSVPALIAAIEDYLRHYNTAPKRFVWTKSADMILDKIARCPKPLRAGH